jgi:hypothetical protein
MIFMTARDRILAKPGPVQVLIRAKMTRAALEDPWPRRSAAAAPDWERYGEEGLAWWDGVMVTAREILPGDSETEVAEWLVDRLRARPVWGKILRGDAQ